MDELLTPAQMAQADALAGAVAPLMEAAGRAVARAVAQRYAPCRTLVLMGPGHNGGDGMAAARHLAELGWPVRALAVGDADIASVARAALVIDAVFGAGLARDIAPPVADLLRAAKRVVAIDMPSGVDGATGAVRGFAPQAELTVTFFRAKPGHFLYPGRGLCGTLLLRDIGLPASVLDEIKPTTWLNGPARWTLPGRTATGHKYRHGDLTVLAGVMPGAARLACGAARRAGAGMVTLAATLLPGQATLLPAAAGLIVRTDPLEALLRDQRRKTWICGPGLGGQAGAALARLIAAGDRLILADADALSACAGQPKKLRGASVITPHEGEFARVFGPVGVDRLAAVRGAAAASAAVTVLKGADTVIASPDGRAVINANAPAWLATGGTGDVLAGIIAALLAQGMPAFEAACAGVFLHGEAAQRLGPGLLAEDIAAQLPAVMAAITSGREPDDVGAGSF